MHWGSKINWASGTESRKDGPPLGIQEAQDSMSAQQCPQDKALAWPICFVTFSTHSLARQTRQTHSAPAFRAPWPCPTHVQADNEIGRSGVGSLNGSRQKPSDCLLLAELVKFKAPPGPAHPTSKEVGKEAATEHSACIVEGRVAGVWDLDPPGVHMPNPKCPRPLLRHPAPASGLVAVPGGRIAEACLSSHLEVV